MRQAPHNRSVLERWIGEKALADPREGILRNLTSYHRQLNEATSRTSLQPTTTRARNLMAAQPYTVILVR